MGKISIYNYGAHPERIGHDLYTFTETGEKEEYKEILQKIVQLVDNPAGTDLKPRIFKILGNRNKAVYSYLFSGKQKDGRNALTSFNLLLNLDVYKDNRIAPAVFERCIDFLKTDWGFGTNYPTGKIKPIKLKNEKNQKRISLGDKERTIREFEEVEILKDKTEALKEILSTLLRNEKIRLVFKNAKPNMLAKIACELYSFLPRGKKDISYTTGKTGETDSFTLLVSTSKPISEEVKTLDLSKTVEFEQKGTWGKIANYAVNLYLDSMQEGLRNFHKEWEKTLSRTNSPEKAASQFALEKKIGTEQITGTKFLEELKKAYLPAHKEKFLKRIEKRMKSSNEKGRIVSFLANECDEINLLEISHKQYPTLNKWWKSQLPKNESLLENALRKCKNHLKKNEYKKAISITKLILKNSQKIPQRLKFDKFLESTGIYLFAKLESGVKINFQKGLQAIAKLAQKNNFNDKEKFRLLEEINRATNYKYNSGIVRYLESGNFCDISSMSKGDWFEETPSFVDYQIQNYTNQLEEYGLSYTLSNSGGKKRLTEILDYLTKVSEKTPKEKRKFTELLLNSIDAEVEGGFSRATGRFKQKLGLGENRNEIKNPSTFKFLSYEIVIPLIYLVKKHSPNSEEDVKSFLKLLTYNLVFLEKSDFKELVRGLPSPDMDQRESPTKNRIRKITSYIKNNRQPQILNAKEGINLPKILVQLANSREDWSSESETLMEVLLESLKTELEKETLKPLSTFKFLSPKTIVPLVYLIRRKNIDYESRLKDSLELLIDNIFAKRENHLRSLVEKKETSRKETKIDYRKKRGLEKKSPE